MARDSLATFIAGWDVDHGSIRAVTEAASAGSAPRFEFKEGLLVQAVWGVFVLQAS